MCVLSHQVLSCVLAHAHLHGVLFQTPLVLDDNDGDEGSNTPQKEQHHAGDATLIAHLSLGGHFLLVRNGEREKKVLSKSILTHKVKTCGEVERAMLSNNSPLYLLQAGKLLVALIVLMHSKLS